HIREHSTKPTIVGHNVFTLIRFLKYARARGRRTGNESTMLTSFCKRVGKCILRHCLRAVRKGLSPCLCRGNLGGFCRRGARQLGRDGICVLPLTSGKPSRRIVSHRLCEVICAHYFILKIFKVVDSSMVLIVLRVTLFRCEFQRHFSCCT